MRFLMVPALLPGSIDIEGQLRPSSVSLRGELSENVYRAIEELVPLRASTMPFEASLRVPRALEFDTEPERSRTRATRSPAEQETCRLGLLRVFCHVPVEFVRSDPRLPTVMKCWPER